MEDVTIAQQIDDEKQERPMSPSPETASTHNHYTPQDSLTHLINNEKQIFKQLQENVKIGLFTRWVNRIDGEIWYLRKTTSMTDEKLGKFRHSQTRLKRKLNANTSHWYDRAKADLEKLTEVQSDSESDEEYRGDEYTTFSSHTFKFHGCKIDDYRYLNQVNNCGIGILTQLPQDMIIPYTMQYAFKTGYTEFVMTPKRGDFYFPEKHK